MSRTKKRKTFDKLLDAFEKGKTYVCPKGLCKTDGRAIWSMEHLIAWRSNVDGRLYVLRWAPHQVGALDLRALKMRFHDPRIWVCLRCGTELRIGATGNPIKRQKKCRCRFGWKTKELYVVVEGLTHKAYERMESEATEKMTEAQLALRLSTEIDNWKREWRERRLAGRPR